jgi:hypothetical protein
MNKLEAFKKVKAYFKLFNIENPIFKFACYSDRMFTYDCLEPIHLELTFLSESHITLLDDMPIDDLFNLEGIEYFNLKSYTTQKRCDVVFNMNSESFNN